MTPEVQAKLVEAISNGGYYDIACRSVGIRYMTFRRWMQRGEKEESGEYCDFCYAIKKAEADCEQEVVRGWVKDDMVGNWQARATFLERRHPERWSKDRLELKKIVKELQDARKEMAEIKALIK